MAKKVFEKFIEQQTQPAADNKQQVQADGVIRAN
jgi:hypothetical protein